MWLPSDPRKLYNGAFRYNQLVGTQEFEESDDMWQLSDGPRSRIEPDMFYLPNTSDIF